MKKIAALTSLTAVLFLNMSCEKQTWEETKMFHQNRTVGAHGGHGAEHGDVHTEGTEAHAPAEGGHAAPAAPAAEKH